MKRNVSLAEISDGRLYKANDMEKRIAVVAMAVPGVVTAWAIPLSWIPMMCTG